MSGSPKTTAAPASPLQPSTAFPADQKPELRRTLGSPSIIFIVIAAAAPLTAATGVLPLSFLFSENAATSVYFIAATLLLRLFAAGYITMSKYVKNAGAFYAYISTGLGRYVGNAAAMLALGAYSLTVIALTIYAGPFTSSLVATLTGWSDSRWWLWSIACCVLLAMVGYRNVELSSRVLAVLLMLEVAILVILGVAIFAAGGKDGIDPAVLSPVEAFGMVHPQAGLCGPCCVSWGSKPPRYSAAKHAILIALSRATYGAAIAIGTLYLFVSFSLVTGAGANGIVELIAADPAAILFALGEEFIGPWFSVMVNVFLLGSIFACALSFHNVVARYQLTMGTRGLLP